MEVGVKFRAYPTSIQKKTLSEWMGCARFIYNAKCDEDRYHYGLSKQEFPSLTLSVGQLANLCNKVGGKYGIFLIKTTNG